MIVGGARSAENETKTSESVMDMRTTCMGGSHTKAVHVTISLQRDLPNNPGYALHGELVTHSLCFAPVDETQIWTSILKGLGQRMGRRL